MSETFGTLREKIITSDIVSKANRYFNVPLVDLKETDEKYKGVLCPEPEVSLPKIGVSDSLLSGAEQYFEKYQQYGYIYGLIKEVLDSFNYQPSGIAVDFGSGFGNTVIPLLENFPELTIIASDISPDLLAILRREAHKRDLHERCIAVAMDAQRDYFKPEIADITFGCAMLHHMAEPEKVVRTALRVLKPGGRAIFLEPFEIGCAILRLAYLEILREAKRLGLQGPGYNFIENINMDIYVRTHRQRLEGWSERWYHLDDKWLFSRSYFEEICKEMGAKQVDIRSLHDSDAIFTNHTRSTLKSYGGLDEDALPKWAWDILERYDHEHFSPEQKKELILEGLVLITK